MPGFNPIEVQKYVTISTGHITPNDMELLEQDAVSSDPALVVYGYEYGAWLLVPPGDELEQCLKVAAARGYTASFCLIVRMAQQHGIAIVRFDRDGGMHDFPVFDWGP